MSQIDKKTLEEALGLLAELIEDLQDLGPSAAELLAAARWTRSQDPSEGFLFVLGELLKSMGHERLIDQL